MQCRSNGLSRSRDQFDANCVAWTVAGLEIGKLVNGNLLPVGGNVKGLCPSRTASGCSPLNK